MTSEHNDFSHIRLIDEATYADVMDLSVLPLLRGFKQDDWYMVGDCKPVALALAGAESQPKHEQGIHSVYLSQVSFRNAVAELGAAAGVGATAANGTTAVAATTTAATATTKLDAASAATSKLDVTTITPAPTATSAKPDLSSVAAVSSATPTTTAAVAPFTNPAPSITQAPAISEKFRGTVVISHGFTESAVKYAEMAWYLLQAGFSVLIVEHRGHGRSLRETDDPMVVTMSDWHLYISDFVGAVRHSAARFGIEGPLHLFSHSLGGAIGAAVLETHPDLFDRAILSSPMMEPKTGMPVLFAYALSATAAGVGEGSRKVPSLPVFSEDSGKNKSGGRSAARVKWYHRQRVLDWEYRTNAPSFDWVVAALSLDYNVLAPSAIARITAPLLMFQSGDDHWVQPGAQTRFLKEARKAGVKIRGIRVPGAGHELFSEPNERFEPYLREVLAFLAA